MPSPSGIRKDSSIFAFGDGGGMPPPYNGVAHINNHFAYKGPSGLEGPVCYSSVSLTSGSFTSPATSDTGREKAMPWAFFAMPICL